MNSDSPTPNLPQKSTSSHISPENSLTDEMEDNSQILPDEEVANVLNFLEHNQSRDSGVPHFISSLVNTSPESPPPQANVNHTAPSDSSPSQTLKINDIDNTNLNSGDLLTSKTSENTVLPVINHQSPADNSKADFEQEAKIPTPPIEQTPTVQSQSTSSTSNPAEKKEVAPPSSPSEPSPQKPAEAPLEIHPNLQVQLKSEEGKLKVILPSEAQIASSKYTWSEIWQQFQVRLKASDRLLVANAGVHLDARDRLLDGRQLQELAETFKEVQLNLESVTTSRRQTAIAAVTAGYSVEQIQAKDILRSPQTNVSALADPIYLETTVRSGVEIRHPGTIIILGDVNPGGTIVADGDILIWGRLRGVAHAGAGGKRECLIMALQMEPTQLRIADAVARAPEKSPQQYYPEVAHITSDAIRISRAYDFSRSQYLNRIDPGKFDPKL